MNADELQAAFLPGDEHRRCVSIDPSPSPAIATLEADLAQRLACGTGSGHDPRAELWLIRGGLGRVSRLAWPSCNQRGSVERAALLHERQRRLGGEPHRSRFRIEPSVVA